MKKNKKMKKKINLYKNFILYMNMVPSDFDAIVITYLLKRIDEDEYIDKEMITKATHTLVKCARYLADEYLTGNENFQNIIKVRQAGFDVYAAEQDRFGWLVGGIRLKRGILYFG